MFEFFVKILPPTQIKNLLLFGTSQIRSAVSFRDVVNVPNLPILNKFSSQPLIMLNLVYTKRETQTRTLNIVGGSFYLSDSLSLYIYIERYNNNHSYLSNANIDIFI